jgi:hypothetical protein
VSRASTLVCLALLVAACDPVVDDAVAALGPEDPNVRRGPLHRPGQPCLLCHDGSLGNPQRFTVAGTVFQKSGNRVAADGVVVQITDANAQHHDIPTNAAGNFYLTPSDYDPTFPLQVILNTGGGSVRMQTQIAGNGTTEPNGACASCHFDPAGADSPGHVCVTLDDGGTPP